MANFRSLGGGIRNGNCNIYYHSYGNQTFSSGTTSFPLPTALNGQTIIGIIGMIGTRAIPSAPIDASGAAMNGWGTRISVDTQLHVTIGTGGSFTNQPFNVVFFYI